MSPEWLGLIHVKDAHQRQIRRREGVIIGSEPEAVWCMEHPSVVTTGRRTVADLPSDRWFAERGVQRASLDRGGLATWHGPGQLVIYLILDLGARGIRTKDFVRAIEMGTIGWLGRLGVRGVRRAKRPGVWVGDKKIAALGFHLRHGVTMYGIAINLSPDLEPFSWFSPCGVVNGGVTSLFVLTGERVLPVEAAHSFGTALMDKIDRLSH